MNASKSKGFCALICCLLLFLLVPCGPSAGEAGGGPLFVPDEGASFEFAKMQPCMLPEKVATGFSEVMQRLVGATYTPVLYVGRQASGCGIEKHLIVCRQVISALGAPEHLVLLTLEHKPDGRTLWGAWAIAGIERIL